MGQVPPPRAIPLAAGTNPIRSRTVFNVLKGQRPDITPAQLAAVLVAGVPVVATLLSAFGVADLSDAQQTALRDALTWAGVLAALLIGGDATLRTVRNVADAR